jgi:hypothetical protein
VFGLSLTSVSGSVGYPVLFLLVFGESAGLPIPGESSIMVAAIAASTGSLWIVAVLLVAIAAAILGDNLGYLCGRTFGRRIWTAGRIGKRRRERWLEDVDDFPGRSRRDRRDRRPLAAGRAVRGALAGRDERHVLAQVLRLQRRRRDRMGRNRRDGGLHHRQHRQERRHGARTGRADRPHDRARRARRLAAAPASQAATGPAREVEHLSAPTPHVTNRDGAEMSGKVARASAPKAFASCTA